MEMLAEFLLLGWAGNPIKKKKKNQKSQRGGWRMVTRTNGGLLPRWVTWI